MNYKTKMDENALARQIVDAACYVHETLGPGLLESVYPKLIVELKSLETVAPVHKK